MALEMYKIENEFGYARGSLFVDCCETLSQLKVRASPLFLLLLLLFEIWHGA